MKKFNQKKIHIADKKNTGEIRNILWQLQGVRRDRNRCLTFGSSFHTSTWLLQWDVNISQHLEESQEEDRRSRPVPYKYAFRVSSTICLFVRPQQVVSIVSFSKQKFPRSILLLRFPLIHFAFWHILLWNMWLTKDLRDFKSSLKAWQLLPTWQLLEPLSSSLPVVQSLFEKKRLQMLWDFMLVSIHIWIIQSPHHALVPTD